LRPGALSPDFAVQVRQAYANLRAALDALGARPDQVAKLTVFVVDHDMSVLEVLSRSVK
jgi:enamine deaminase RidA (YjgF/YER057c/UK114 family)